ncbi:sensor histidine kinase [Faecalimonas sp. LCP19S3_D12]
MGEQGAKRQNDGWKGIGVTIAILAIATGIGAMFRYLRFTEANILIVYVLGVMITAVITASRMWSVLSSLCSVLLFNFLYTEPRFSLTAYDSGYPITFVIAFLAAIIASNLAIQLRKQAEQSALMAYRTKILLETNQILQKAKNAEEIIREAAGQIVKLIGKSVVYYECTDGILCEPSVCLAQGEQEKKIYISAKERETARYAFESKKRAGASTEVKKDAVCMYLTIRNGDNVYGVIGVALKGIQLNTFESNLLLSILGECALALEKEIYNRKREEAVTKAKNEQLRANLLRSISHDLRTPLTSISGNVAILLNNEEAFDKEKRRQLYTGIYDDSMWLINLVENLLSVTRLEESSMRLNMQVELVDEVIEEALKHISRKREEHQLVYEPSEELLLAKMDSRLIVQVLINLVENAIKYTQEGSRIEISAVQKGDMIQISVADNGKGIKEDAKEKIFDMFYTAENKPADSRRGLGLGLFLAKSIIHAHDGIIWVTDNVPSGTIFSFTLQAEEVTISE